MCRSDPLSFVPATCEEMRARGWERLDVILVTGDADIDAPHIGVAVIGRVMLAAGYRVGIIAQPDVTSGTDITRLGEPDLFWGVTAGCMDSMVANYTASGKKRRSDDLTPGGRNSRRPDRAVIVYANLIRRHFKQTRPIVLGGMEASLRRISHYDFWTDSVRRSLLFDAKADILVYGMGEKTILQLAEAISAGRDIRGIRGICFISRDLPEPREEFPGPDTVLPDHGAVRRDPDAFIRMFTDFYAQTDPFSARRLVQRQDTRYLVQNPPQAPPSPADLDRIYELPFTRDVHPACRAQGPVPAMETIRFALTTHRGCYGECRFCAITAHQGRHVVSRSRESLLREAAAMTTHPSFKGIISDVGGPTANMYGFECRRKAVKGACPDRGCLFPETCRQLPVDHEPQIELLRALSGLPGVRRVFIGSGLRYDLILGDRPQGRRYLTEILRRHVSGQLKVAPEHVVDAVLKRMGKPGVDRLTAFKALFEEIKGEEGLKVFLTYYLMAAYPGCTQADMRAMADHAHRFLGHLPEQVQIFTPTPGTWAALMYHTETDPRTGERIFVEKRLREKQKQKDALRKNRRRT